ncbi:alkaline-phosphatase-like protein [Fusarium solani]|uniref:Arylsulfatase n=1 Tax=Fusarium solani TaxID=169388 RepID=A0A9P9GA03_FUSSL|nr:alkaline-phosphatase-like protein [Fusarium solani]KAH7235071.1 alkaline-phosphatase-like protein [Fusarium solani]
MKTSLALLACFSSLWREAAASRQPNILFILTDDQDWHMKSLKHMPLLQKYLINEGTLYSNHYCTVALCCPSRVNLWTGRAAHNTNVNVWAPYGGYPKIVREGINDNYLPHWLQAAGYNTYYSGKLWNHHTVENYNQPYAGGFNGSDFLLDPHTYQYLNATMTRNGAPPVNYAGQYSPDLTAQKAYGFLDDALSNEEPWFLVHAPIAPHGTVDLTPNFFSDAPKYAKRHAHLFKDYIIPRDESFNPEVQGGVSWVKELPRLNDTVIAYNDEYQRARLRALQSVDEMVETMIKKVEAAGQLDNTYIIYTTDNGYHISQHRMHPGKECGFETDVHIPLIIRGRGVPAGHISQAVTAHTDLASTIMSLAGRALPDTDGTPIPLSIDAEAESKQEHVTIEYWGLAIPEGVFGWYGENNMSDPGYGAPGHAADKNTYKAIRVIGESYNIYYSVWCTNEKEFYDLKVRNLLSAEHSSASYSLRGRSFDQITPRLDALMMVLKSCKGRTCVEPWRELHPSGDVNSLLESLKPEFDAFYQDQPKVSFSDCKVAYFPEFEGPMEVNKFENSEDAWWWPKELKRGVSNRDHKYRGRWSHWT